MEWITAHWTEIALAVTSTLYAMTHIAALTPSPKDDEAIGKLWKVFSFLTGNYGTKKP